MIVITVDNSYSKISGLSMKQMHFLRKELSYTVGGSSAYFSGYGIRRKSLLNKHGEFATGLIHRVYSFLDLNRLSYNSNYKNIVPRIKPRKQINCDLIPYEDQSNALSAAIRNKRGIISMPTGTGKSHVIHMIVAELNVNTLIVVPTLELKAQLQSILRGMDTVTIENIDSKALNRPLNYDCLIIDEGHHAAAKTYQRLNRSVWQGIYYRFFFTATPFRNDTEETLLFEAICGQVIYKLDYRTAVSKGYIVPIEAYYLESIWQETNTYSYSEVYKQLIVRNDYRNLMIARLAKILKENNIYTLILVKEIAHGKELSSITGIEFINGEDTDSRSLIDQFNEGLIKILIGTMGILGEGVDTKPCEYIIMAGGGKAKSQFMQAIGRGTRRYENKESAKVILIQDKSHKFLTRHFNMQCAILKKEYNVICQKLNIMEAK